MINCSHGAVSIRGLFKMSLHVVPSIVDTRYASNSDASYFDHSSITKIINIWSHPASIRQLLQVVWSFMVPSNEDRQDGSFNLTTVVPVFIQKFLKTWSLLIIKNKSKWQTCKMCKCAWTCPARPCTANRFRSEPPESLHNRWEGPLWHFSVLRDSPQTGKSDPARHERNLLQQ